jgi:hypothetical protein
VSGLSPSQLGGLDGSDGGRGTRPRTARVHLYFSTFLLFEQAINGGLDLRERGEESEW